MQDCLPERTNRSKANGRTRRGRQCGLAMSPFARGSGSSKALIRMPPLSVEQVMKLKRKSNISIVLVIAVISFFAGCSPTHKGDGKFSDSGFWSYPRFAVEF